MEWVIIAVLAYRWFVDNRKIQELTRLNDRVRRNLETARIECEKVMAYLGASREWIRDMDEKIAALGDTDLSQFPEPPNPPERA